MHRNDAHRPTVAPTLWSHSLQLPATTSYNSRTLAQISAEWAQIGNVFEGSLMWTKALDDPDCAASASTSSGGSGDYVPPFLQVGHAVSQ